MVEKENRTTRTKKEPTTMNTKLLEDIGLTKSEIKVYLALLELGSTTSGPIVEKSGASSSKIYEILEKLMQKGLASFIIKAGTKHFEATGPERLMDYINEKESKITEQKQELRSIIPELELKRKLQEYRSEATIFKGIKGVETAYNDILKTMKPGEEYYVFGSMEPTEPYFTFIQRYHKKRAAKGIKVKLLYSKDVHELAAKIKELPHTEIKFSPPQLVTSSFVVMYANKTLITVGTKKDLTLFRIENKEVTESFKSQFYILWNQDVTVGTGFETFEKEWQELFDELKQGESYDVLGAGYGPKDSEKHFASYFSKLHQERIKRGIKGRLLFQPGAEKAIEKYGVQPLYHNGLEYKNTPVEYEFPVQIFAAKERSILLVQKKYPVTIVIKNKEIAASFRQYFNHLWNQEVTTYRGIEGIKDIFRKTLKCKETWFIGGKGYIAERDPTFFFKEYVPEAQKTHHHWKNLAQPGKIVPEIENLPFAETRYLPQTYITPHVIFIFGDYVANVLWEKEPLAYLIHDKNVAKSYRDYFELLWDQEQQTLKGFDGIKELCNRVLKEEKDLYLIGANGALYQKYKQFFYEFDAKRVEKSIKRYHLALEKTRDHAINKQKETEVRYLPESFGSPMVIWIFGSNVANILWDEELIYITKNQKIADDYRKYFQMLWENVGQ